MLIGLPENRSTDRKENIMGERALQNRIMKLKEIEAQQKALEEHAEKIRQEIKHFTAHALRDTFTTQYIEQGGSPQTLKAILGHSSLALTMDLYSHVLSNTKQQEMDNLRIVL